MFRSMKYYLWEKFHSVKDGFSAKISTKCCCYIGLYVYPNEKLTRYASLDRKDEFYQLSFKFFVTIEYPIEGLNFNIYSNILIFYEYIWTIFQKIIISNNKIRITIRYLLDKKDSNFFLFLSNNHPVPITRNKTKK